MMDIKKLCETYDTLYSKLSAELQKNGYDRAIVDELSEGIIGKLNNKIDDTYLPFLEYITQTNRPYHDAFTSSNLLRLLQSSNTAFGLTCGVEAPLALMCIYLVDGTLTEATYYFARNGEEAEDDGMCDSGYKIGIRYFQGTFSPVTFSIVNIKRHSSRTYQTPRSGAQLSLAGKTIVVTGDLVNFPEPGPYPQRVEFRKLVEKHGGKLTSSISAKTSYLICNDKNSGTVKVRQAREKNIPILTEKQFLRKIGFSPKSIVIPRVFKTDNGKLTKYYGHSKTVTIPDGITAIADCAFWGCTNLQAVTIPNSVTSIGDSAFRDCRNLQSVTIPESVKTIGGQAFHGCDRLADKDGFIILNGQVCEYVGSCRNVAIPEDVTKIADGAFCDCRNLQSVTIPDGVTEIGNSAFRHCSSLQSVNIPESVARIGWWAFDGCNSLQSVTIPTSVTKIEDGAFGNCINLQSVTIPEGVTEIGRDVFHRCISLQSVTIPKSMRTIGREAFCLCSSLRSVTIPDSVTTIYESSFQKCDNLQLICAPGVQFIPF